MSIEQKLQEIDLQFEAMPQQNRMMVYFSIVIGLIGFTYYFFGVSLQEDAVAKEEKVIALQTELAQNKVSKFEEKIAKNQQRILLLAQEHQDEEYKSRALRTKLERMDYLSSNAKGLADILERILKESVVLGINLDKITLDKTLSDYAPQIQKRGTIVIEGKAAFRSVLKLLRFIESQEALIEIVNVNFDLDEKTTSPDFTISIAGYGINL
jgi:hypothetical protein